MKTTKILLGSLLVAGLLGLCSCVTSGYVGADEGVYYGPGDPWFHEGPWVYGHPWYGGPREHVGVYIHPPRPAPHPSPHPAPHSDHRHH